MSETKKTSDVGIPNESTIHEQLGEQSKPTNPFDENYEERGIDVDSPTVEHANDGFSSRQPSGKKSHVENVEVTVNPTIKPSVTTHVVLFLLCTKNLQFQESTPTKSVDDEQTSFEKGPVEKFINYIFCRGDLSKAKLKTKPTTVKDLFKYGNKLDKLFTILGIIVSMLCGICQPLFAIVTGRIANVLLIIPPESEEFIQQGTNAVIFYMCVGLFLIVVAFLQFFFFNVACVRIIRNIRVEYLRSILRQDASWLEKNHSGSINTHLNDNIDRICEGIGDKFGLLIRNGTQYCTGLAVAFYTSWQMAAPLCILSPIIAAIMGFSSRVSLSLPTAMPK
uniref:ABC transmembrane type-1 domain-containing protein n=1 Tax=Steinernema glaseri TaxID=37863 RepID=A0A1I8ASF9_9BILA